MYYSIPTATDNIGIATDVTCTPPPASSFSVGTTTTVECSVTDSSGNTGTASFTITVTDDTGSLHTPDTTPPVLTVPANQILYVENSLPVYDSLLQITYAEGGIVGDSPEFSWFSSLTGVDTVTNSTGTYSQIIMPNCQVPVLTGPYSGFNYSIMKSDPYASGVIQFSWPEGTVVRYASTTTGMPSSSSHSSGPTTSIAFPMGTTTLNCMATDMAGNVATDSFTVTVTQEGVSSNTFATGASFAPGKDFSELGVQTFEGTATFGEFTEFAKSQEFSNSMTFEKYQHFEDSTDFTAISQTFKEGTTLVMVPLLEVMELNHFL